jgi:hypothetical protein
MIYKTITNNEAKHCPGGTCEIKTKEPIQMFNPIQKVIAGLTIVALVSRLYLFLAKTESQTFFGEFLHDVVLTKQQLETEKELKFQQEADKAFEDDE